MKEVIIKTSEDTSLVSSLEVAEMFNKKHNHVIEAIEELKLKNSIVVPMFIESTYKVQGNNKTYKCYKLTQDGFNLLVMGFTGKKSHDLKLKYIKILRKCYMHTAETKSI